MQPPRGAAVHAAAETGWRRGPLPAGTWFWGALVTRDVKVGFYFADFRGDHAVVYTGAGGPRLVEAEDVAWYDNGLTLPPDDPSGGG
jgi:hypothetical protein